MSRAAVHISHHLLQLALVACLLINQASCGVTIRNWTTGAMILVTANPGGTSEELEPNEWIQYTTTNGVSGVFTIANQINDDVVTIMLYKNQTLALVTNIKDSIDGILVDTQGRKIRTVFINL